MDTTFTLDQLSALTDLSLRTIRYYIQLGLVDRHEGDRKHARYTQRHLDQLLQVRAMADQGIPLERIKHEIHGTTPPPPPPRSAGDISVSKSGKAGPVDSELKLLRYQREYLNKVMADLRNAAKPKKTAEQIALQSLKARMKNEAAKLACG